MARGNIVVDLDWKNGRLEKVGLMAKNSIEIQLVYGEANTNISLESNQKIWLDSDLKKVD